MEAGRSAPPEALDKSTPEKSTLGGLLVSPSKPVAARRGQWRLSRGLHWHAALPHDAACLRTGVVWTRTTSHCSSSDAGPPVLKMPPPGFKARRGPVGARDGAGGECAQHRPRGRASALWSWHQASRTADFPRGHRTTESHDAPGGLRRSFGGRQPLGPSTGGIQWPALYGAGPSAWPTADHRQSRPATRVAVLMLISVFNALPRRSSVILRSGSPMCRPSFLALDAFVHDPNSRFPP